MCSNSYLRSVRVRWGWRDRANSIVLAIIVTGLLVMMRHIGLSIKKIITNASSYNRWASKEGSHNTLTPLGRFGEFEVRAEGLDDPGGEIVLVLEKSES